MYIKSYHGSKIVSTFGIFGVAIFLCITGYYIYNLAKRIVGLKFVKKRLLRIWPAYFVAITICFALTRFVELPNRTVSLFEYFLNIPFVNGYIGTPYVDGAHWYLTTLVSGIVIYSVILNFKDKFKYYLLIVWLILIGLFYYLSTIKIQGVSNELIQFFFKCIWGEYIPFLVLGNLIRLLENKKDIIYLIIICSLVIIDIFLTMGTLALLIAFWASVVIMYALYSKSFILKSRLIAFIGMISYSIYLIHQNIGFVIINSLVDIAGQYQLWMSIIVSILTIIMGTVFYFCVEKPIAKIISNRRNSSD